MIHRNGRQQFAPLTAGMRESSQGKKMRAGKLCIIHRSPARRRAGLWVLADCHTDLVGPWIIKTQFGTGVVVSNPGNVQTIG